MSVTLNTNINNNNKSTDPKNKKKEPDTASFKEGARALISRNSMFQKDIRYINDPLSGPRDSKGRMIITYTTDLDEPK